MKHHGFRSAAQALLILTGLLLAACASTPGSSSTAGGMDEAALPAEPGDAITVEGGGHHTTAQIAPELPDGRNLQPLPEINGPKPRLPLRQLSVTPQQNVVAMRVLIVGTGPADQGLPATQAMFDQAGVPYDVMDATTATTLSADALVAPDGTGRYQGIVLTSGNLAYEASPGVWQSALEWAEWNLLWQYEQDYAVRQLSMYTYPSTWPEDYGLRDAGVASATSSPTLTTAGQSVFSDLKTAARLPIRLAYNYPSTVVPVAGMVTTPLLTDARGRVLAARSDVGGRERVALTFAQNPNLLHSALIGSSLVKWLTKGLYLGEYRRFNQLDIDDWFLPGDVYDPATNTVKPDAFRISASDALSLVTQQATLRAAFPVANSFKFAMMYNGGGANLAAPFSCSVNVSSPDRLTSISRCLANEFDWVSHTKDHLYMDFLSYADSLDQLQPNLDIGAQLGLNISTRSLLTGDMSGLGYYNPAGDGPKTDYGLGASNPNFLQAAQVSGAKYLASNRSVPSQWDPTCSGCGLPHPLNPSIFLVPRWPTNIFYHVTTPAQATAAYNAVYGPGGTAPYWPQPLTYNQLLDKESDIALAHVLSGVAYPHYMHQDNLRQHAPVRSLAYDWLRAVLNKYALYSNLPLKTLRWDDLGAYVQSRTSYMKSGLSGSWDRTARTVTLRSAAGGTAFVTGAAFGQTERYGGVDIGSTTLTAGEVLTVTVP